MTKLDNWYAVHQATEIDSPALLVYRQRAIENIQRIKRMFDDPDCIRPHVKTHKTREIVRLMLDEGITKFKCATIAEAEMLGLCEAKDVLLAYPVSGPKLFRFISLIKKYPLTIFSCLVDNRECALQISTIASAKNVTINVYLDLNVGMNRTGILPGEEALRLYEECSGLENVNMQGLHVYDGHIKEKDFNKRETICNEAFEPVEEMRKTLSGRGFNPRMVAGGSATLPVHLKRKNAECSPGTFIYWDKGYGEWIPELDFLPAALVMTRIISLPAPLLICTDLGYKSIASENDIGHRFHFLNAPDLVPENQSEEHLVLRSPTPHSWKVGDILYVMPVHICPTCALYEEAKIVEDGMIKDTWKIIARDRKIDI